LTFHFFDKALLTKSVCKTGASHLPYWSKGFEIYIYTKVKQKCKPKVLWYLRVSKITEYGINKCLHRA